MTRRKRAKPGTLWLLLRRLGPHARPHRKRLAIGFLAMSIVAMAEVIRPWPVKVIFDGLLIPQTSPDAIMTWAIGWFGQGNMLLTVACAAIVLIAVVGGVAGYVQSTMIATVGQQVVADIRLELYLHVQRLSHSFHDSVSTADIISRLTGDVRMMRDLLVEAGVLFAARLMVLFATIVVMALMDWRLTLAALTVLPGLIWLTQRYGGRIKDAARQQRRGEGRIAVVMTEGISAISLVKGFANEAHEEARFTEQNISSVEAGVLSTRVASEMDRMVQVVLAIGTCAVMWYGVIRVRDGAISPGDLLVFAAYLTTLYKPIRRMSSMSARVAKATASGERLLEVLDLQPEIADRPDATAAPYLRRWDQFRQCVLCLSRRQPGAGERLADHSGRGNRGLGGAKRDGQILGRETSDALLRSAGGPHPAGWARSARVSSGQSARPDFGGAARQSAFCHHDPRQHRLWPPRCHGGRDHRSRRSGRGRSLHPPHADGL